ncbi:MAG: trigger factor [Microgenomates group bacterium Gr01-1014_5]|nr:MAG: trigger factor [Microgenomates group bacterium Gr01-1014_5]
MPKVAKSAKVTKEPAGTVLARLDDGTIQLTFTIPFAIVQTTREAVLKELANDVEVPGFRKGKAPLDLAMKNIDRQRLYEHTLQHLLPQHYAKAVLEHNLRPVLQPRFELVSIDPDPIGVEEERDWTIRAVTCELPEIDLGDYKKTVSNSKKTEVWTPAKGDPKASNEPSREEREQQIINALLESATLSLPKPLIEEEINHKLSQLLDQVQKLGLTVEQYLASTNKTVEQLKQDYASQSQASIKLVLILNRVAEAEKVQVSEAEIEEVISATSSRTEGNGQAKSTISTPEQKSLIRAVLSRRKALDSLVNLI